MGLQQRAATKGCIKGLHGVGAASKQGHHSAASEGMKWGITANLRLHQRATSEGMLWGLHHRAWQTLLIGLCRQTQQ